MGPQYAGLGRWRCERKRFPGAEREMERLRPRHTERWGHGTEMGSLRCRDRDTWRDRDSQGDTPQEQRKPGDRGEVLGVRDSKQDEDSRRDLQRPRETPKRKEMETGCVRKKRGRQQKRETRGRVAEMERPQEAKMPRGMEMLTQGGVSSGDRLRGSLSPRDRLGHGEREPEAETGTKRQKLWRPSIGRTSGTWLHLSVPQFLYL